MSQSMWSALLLHEGMWLGSSQYFNGEGAWESEQKTSVSLAALNNQQTIQQRNEYFAENGELAQAKEWEYSSLSRSVLFFENGAFSQGSTQYAPYGDFGAEFGFIAGKRRLRSIPLYHSGHLHRMTLIREHQENTPRSEMPTLTPGQLVGYWHGQATTLFPDLRPPETLTTSLEIHFDGQTLDQHLKFGTQAIQSSGAWDGQHLTFGESPGLKLFCLPDGASCTLPPHIPPQAPFFLEVGWLVNPQTRVRLIRRYDQAGGWNSLTLVQETKVE